MLDELILPAVLGALIAAVVVMSKERSERPDPCCQGNFQGASLDTGAAKSKPSTLHGSFNAGHFYLKPR